MSRISKQSVLKSLQISISILLVLAVSIVSFAGFYTVKAKPTQADRVTVYYPLKGAVDENGGTNNPSKFVGDFYETSDWLFQGKDFGSGASVFYDCDADFEKPRITAAEDGKSAVVAWDAVADADSYRITAFNGNKILSGSPFSTSETSITLVGLTENNEYFVQVTAYENDVILKSSQIGSFFAYDKTDNETLLIKGDSQTGTANFTGVKEFEDGSKALYYAGKTTDTYVSLVFGSGNIFDFSGGIEAFAFRYGQEATDPNNEKWLSMAFVPRIDTNDNASYSGIDTTMYYITDDGEVYESKNSGNARFSSLNYPQIKGGWVIIPADLFAAGYFAEGATHRFILTIDSLYEISYDPATDSYTRSSNQVKLGGYNIFFSDFCAISDLEDFKKSLTYKGSEYSAAGPVVYDCNEQNTEAEALENSSTGSKYTYGYYDSDKARATLSYNLKASGAHRYGMSLGFEAPEDGIYDLTNYIKIENCKKDAEVYYRVVKEDADGNTTGLWPLSEEWYSISCNTENSFSPEDGLECVEAALSAGELLRIEAYAEFGDGSDGELEIRLCNTALTKTETVSQESGDTTEYRAVAYTDCFRNETLVNEGYYYVGQNRWNISAIDIADSCKTLELTKYIPYYGRFTKYGNSDVGYYTALSNNNASISTQTNSQYGIRLSFLSSKTGIAELSFDNQINKESKFRILSNGEQIYPDSGWSEETGNISRSFEIYKGDIIAIEQYSDTQTPASVEMGDVKITVTETPNTSNIPGSDYYAALWVRPYNSQVYNGDYDQSGSVWGFNFTDSNSQITSGNAFSSQAGGIIYNKENGTDTGYIFEDSQIILKLDKAKKGASLSFTAPETGYYDFSYAVSVLSGNGEIKYRLRLDNQGLYPENGWGGFTEGEEVLKLNDEIYLGKDQKLYFEIYADSLTGPMKISLGSPVVVSGVTVTPNSDGNTAAYNPADYIRLERGYSGALRLDGKRFEYQLISNGVTKPVDTADYRNRLLKNGETGAGFEIEDDEISASRLGNNTAVISYTPVRYGASKITASPYSDSDFVFTVRKINGTGGTVLFGGAGQTSYDISLELTAEEGDIILFEASGADEISFGKDMLICTDGVYPTENEPDSNIFIASLDCPYDDADYTGDYNGRSGIWGYNVLNISSGEYVSENVNYYDSSDRKHLYHKESKAGYYFSDKLLYADLTEKAGISLEFNVPYSESFEFSTGLKIMSSDSQIDIYARILKNGETVWPESGGWHTEENVTVGTDISVPMQYLTLAEGDKVSLQIYADGISDQEKVELALAAPQFKLQSSQKIANSDFSAKILTPYGYTPFAELGYDSGYIADGYPITQSMWNFEFIDLLESDGSVNTENPEEKTANNYKHQLSNDILSDKNGFNNPNYMIYPEKMELRVFASLNKNTDSLQEVGGESLRFVAPEDGEMIISGAPYLNKKLLEGQEAYFRILLNDETVYPETGWEVFKNDKTASDFKELRLTLNAGDELKYQFYTYADASALSAYSNKACSQIFVFSPSIVLMESVVSEKYNFDFVRDMPALIQLSPFWKAQYTLDISNPVWTNMETYHSSWRYWLASGKNYMGISPTGSSEYWLSNTSLGESTHPGVAVTYTAHATGYMQFSQMTIKVTKLNTFVAGQFRITKNGDTIYPENGGWLLIDDDTSETIKDTSFAIEKGDEIRFEVTSKEPLASGEQLKIAANPKFVYSKYDTVYSKDDDIFGMLDEEMYDYFKGIQGGEFDSDPKLSQSNSAKFLSNQEKLTENWLSKLAALFDGGDTSTGDSSLQNTQTTDGYYIEGTPDTVIKRRKKIVTTISGGIPTYAVIIISIAAAAVLAAGVTLLILLIKRKKNRKVKQQ